MASPYPEYFLDFIEVTPGAFRFLEAEHGFERTEPFIRGPECNIEFSRAHILISITYEDGGEIWIWIMKEGSPMYELHRLIKRMSPSRAEAVSPVYRLGHRSRAEIKAQLAAYADFLRKEGRGILEGDFSLFKPEDRIGRSGE